MRNLFNIFFTIGFLIAFYATSAWYWETVRAKALEEGYQRGKHDKLIECKRSHIPEFRGEAKGKNASNNTPKGVSVQWHGMKRSERDVYALAKAISPILIAKKSDLLAVIAFLEKKYLPEVLNG